MLHGNKLNDFLMQFINIVLNVPLITIIKNYSIKQIITFFFIYIYEFIYVINIIIINIYQLFINFTCSK